MKNTPKYSVSLTETLKESDLKDVGVDIAETIIDSALQDGILKDIPFLGSLIGIGKTASKVKDVLFLKKVLYFINEIKNIPPEEREKVISEIDNSEKYRLKIGEKLLYILDKADDHEKTLLVGKLFSAFLKQEIDYDIFLRGSSIIDKSIIEDLNWFIDHDWEILSIEEAGEFINWGLFELDPLNIKVKDDGYSHNSQWEEKPNYSIEGGRLTASISFVGKKIRQYLK
ncbi:MAG: hypothetical protein Q7T12_03650 [Flavobacterium sp.]|nr:hypothetical protein [Flavobacterium sp.]